MDLTMDNKIKIKSNNLNVFYGQKQALFDINLEIKAGIKAFKRH